MVKKTLPDNITRLVRSFRSLLEKDNIPVDSMIVFGSEAKGTARAESDIDVCVVSPLFGNDKITEMQILFRKAGRIDSRIEPYPMSPKDLKDTYNPIVSEIVKWGILV
ncbi:MAG TPA: nucleotidyltransferase domain-containing protein [Candidatus Paceibacterota bacterium]